MSGRPGGVLFPRDILGGDTLEAARAMLGATLVREAGDGGPRRAGRIVEVEAYVGLDDRASHARMGPTARNRVMFGPPGIAYVYLVYGMHHCLNVVTGPDGFPAAILVRAVEPTEGRDAMRAAGRRPGIADARLAAGPGLVGAAFGVTREETGNDLTDPSARLRLEARPDDATAPRIVAGPRIGIAYAGEPWTSVAWRFAVAGRPALSRRIG